jgi:hypothetical protein
MSREMRLSKYDCNQKDALAHQTKRKPGLVHHSYEGKHAMADQYCVEEVSFIQSD